MKWLLLMIAFTGPTSPDRITFEWHNSKQECEKAWLDLPHNWISGRPEHICIPFEK